VLYQAELHSEATAVPLAVSPAKGKRPRPLLTPGSTLIDNKVMIDLTKPWPLGLDRRSWPWFCAAIIACLAALSLLDIWASRGTIGWTDAVRAPFFAITDYGLSDWVLIPSLVILLVALPFALLLRGLARLVAREITMLSAFIFAGVGAPGLMANLLKRIVGRGRPTEYDASGAFSFQTVLNDWTFQSFPSGHATTAIAMAFVGGFVWPRLFPLLLLVGVVVSFSRIPVGMHYPTDVFGGLVVGALGAYLVRNIFASRGWMFRFAPDGHVRFRGFPAIRRLVSARRRSA
jgi:membrane-associated phospholipid phosphatase